MPWNDGNSFAVTHGFYRERITEDEQRERRQWERQVIRDLGGPKAVSTTQRALVRTAGYLRTKLERLDRAAVEGKGEPAEQQHVLAVVNSFRLVLAQIGIGKKAPGAMNLQDYLKAKQKGSGSER